MEGSARRGKAARDRAIREAYIRYGCTLAEIGEFLGLLYATLSRLVRRATP